MNRTCSHCQRRKLRCVPSQGGCEACLSKGLDCAVILGPDSDQTQPPSPDFICPVPPTLKSCTQRPEEPVSDAVILIESAMATRGLQSEDLALVLNFFKIVVEGDPQIQSHPVFHPSHLIQVCQAASAHDFKLIVNCLCAALGFRIAIATRRYPCPDTIQFYSETVDMIPGMASYEHSVVNPLLNNCLHLINIWTRPFLPRRIR